MNAKVSVVQILSVFVLLVVLAFNVEGNDVSESADVEKDKVPNASNKLDPASNSSAPSQPGKDDPKVEPNPTVAVPKGPTAVPRSLIAVIKAYPHQPLPTLPLIGLFAVYDKNITCIVLKSGIRLTMNYRNATGSGQWINQSVFDVPVHNYTVEGQCNPNHQSISIIFFADQDLKWNLTLEFARNATDQNLAYSEKISVDYAFKTGLKPFPWAKTLTATSVYNTPGFFSLTLGTNYICLVNSRASNFTQAPDSQITEMFFYGLQVQAFRTEKNSTELSQIIVQCAGDAVSNTVPLYVGLFLLVLIISVLVVFIVRRRMLDRRAHQKMALGD